MGFSVSGGVKRLIDIVVSLVSLVCLLPILLGFAALIVLTSPGPVFFRQPREGLHGQVFYMYKFRSMYLDKSDRSGIQQTIDGDARVTPLGRIMRRRSIDELPQLLNVLKGDMSLVGPRPHVAGMLAAGMPYAQLVPYYGERLRVKPGLTGWAQVNGYRGPTFDAKRAVERIDHDIAYIRNFSLSLDIQIIARTAIRELIHGSGI
jgi:lipopolysaccharide/colanic/teichoic acid biosynthesis glycosyltransferase